MSHLFLVYIKMQRCLGCLFNQSPPLRVAIGASFKEWSLGPKVKLGCHFILVTGVSAPQDQTSCFLALQRRHLSFKSSNFLRLLLLFYNNPSSSSTSPLGTGHFLSYSSSPLGWSFPATRTIRETTVNERTTDFDQIPHLCVWLCIWMGIKKGQDISLLLGGKREEISCSSTSQTCGIDDRFNHAWM